MLGNMGICDLDQEREADWALCRIVPCETRTSATLACMPEGDGVTCLDPDQEPDPEPDPYVEALVGVLVNHPPGPEQFLIRLFFGSWWQELQLRQQLEWMRQSLHIRPKGQRGRPLNPSITDRKSVV